MEFAKIYDEKINEELKEYEKLQWDMFYRTLLPDHMQQFEQEYDGNPDEKAVEEHKTELIAKHTLRIQKLLDRKREKLTIKCLGDIINQLETAQHEADQDEGEWNPEDYKELGDEPETSCEGEQALASEIIADQSAEIEKLKAELQDKQENLDICAGLADRCMYRQRIVECALKLKDEKILKCTYTYMKKLTEEEA